MGSKKSEAMPQPDRRIGENAAMNAQLSREWLDFTKQQHAEGRIRQDEMDDLTREVVAQQMATQDKANARADQQWDQYQQDFKPIEQRVAREAMEYDSPERQAQAAAEARTDVQRALAGQSASRERNMASMGINPGSGRFAGITRADATQGAIAEAGAANTGRKQVRDMGIMLRKDAAGFGRNMPGTAAQNYGIGIQAGNSALGAKAGATGQFFQNNGQMTQGFGGAMQGFGSSAGILSGLYANQVNAWGMKNQADAASSAGIGGMIGQGIGAYAAL